MRLFHNRRMRKEEKGAALHFKRTCFFQSCLLVFLLNLFHVEERISTTVKKTTKKPTQNLWLGPLCMKIDALSCRLSTVWHPAPGRRPILSTPPTISYGIWTQTQSMRSECCWPDQEREERANLDPPWSPAPNVQVGHWLTGWEGDDHGASFLIPDVFSSLLLKFILWTSTLWPLQISDCLLICPYAAVFLCYSVPLFEKVGKVGRREHYGRYGE